ncbi:MAG TPA: ABC transporter permease [Acidisarcina sp.]
MRSNVWLIAKREYLEQVRGKAFRLTTILIPAIFVCIFGVGYLASKNSGNGKHIVIAAADAGLASNVKSQLLSDPDSHTGIEVVAPAGENDRADLIRRVTAKQIDGFLWVDSTRGSDTPHGAYYSLSSGDFVTTARLQGAVSRSVVQQRLAARGIAPAEIESITKSITIDTQKLDKNGKASSSNAMGTFWAAYAMAFLLSFTVVLYGMNVGRSVIQEKTSRIFEVMLASVKPGDMLAGKLVGVGAVGITQLGIWFAAAGIFIGTPLAGRLMAGGFDLHLISVTEGVLFVLYFLLGYVLYSALFAGLASTVSTEQELQQYSPIAAVPIWLSFGMITYIVSNPNSKWSVAMSLFPPCAPITMFLRMASQFPPFWQIGASIGLMVLAILATLWFAARIYSVGILMYGKRATLPEMMRWLRYS